MNTATVEIEITPPGPPGRAPWWTVLFDGTDTTVRTIADDLWDEPEDWGIMCANPKRTEAWLADGGSTYVIEQILKEITNAGASPRIVAIHGTAEGIAEMRTALHQFTEEHPDCASELSRFIQEKSVQ